MGFMTYDFDIPGEPVAKGRPRFYGYRAVTPQHTRDAEELVRNQFHMFYSCRTIGRGRDDDSHVL
jgi:hypothetical protein